MKISNGVKQKGLSAVNVILAVVLILVIGILVWAVKNGEEDNSNPQQETSRGTNSPKKEVPQDQLPSDFPADVPQEQGAEITQNYEIENTTDGRSQSTRTFQSQKTVAENYDIYLSYFENNGWEIFSQSQSEDIASIFARKADAELSATISRNTITGAVVVELAYLK